MKATDVVYSATLDDDCGRGVAARIAARAGSGHMPSPGSCPALRPHVARSPRPVVRRKNALLGAAIFIPGADLPVLTLNEMRMVRRIADAYGVERAAGTLPDARRRRGRRAGVPGDCADRARDRPVRASGEGRGRLRRDAGRSAGRPSRGSRSSPDVPPGFSRLQALRMPLIRFQRHPRAPAQIGRAGSRRKRQTRRLP